MSPIANDITNKLTFLQCSRERCQEILKAIQKDNVGIGSIDFNKIIPQPDGLYMGNIGTKEWQKYKNNNWYDWCKKNWGTKSNSYGYNTNGIQYDEDNNQICFLSANDSPLPIIQELSHQYPDVLFELRFADENLGYNVEEIKILAGECVDLNIPRYGTYEAQKLAADIIGLKLEFDIESASGYVRMLDENLYEYCEGVHISPSFQCEQSLGHPVVLCYDFDNSKVWLEMYPLLDEDDDMYQDIKNSIQSWGIHPCNSWDDFNSYVICLGDNAMEAAYYDEGEMTMC